jgi:ABC-type transporter Mla subunit MlaD
MINNKDLEPSSNGQNSTALNQVRALDIAAIQLWIGRAIQFTSAAGIVLGFLGMILVPIFIARASSWIDARMQSASQEADSLAASISQANTALDNGVKILDKAGTTIRSIGISFEDSGTLIDSSASLIGETAPEIIDDTRDALVAAEEGAGAVDQVLRNLAKISFLTGVSYAPEKPLDEAISEVAVRLEPLPGALRQVGDELSQTHADIEDVCTALSGAADELEGFVEEFEDKDGILVGLVDGLDDFSQGIEDARRALHPAALIGVLMIELVIIGHVMGQAAIYYVGGEMAARIQNESVKSIITTIDGL